MFSLTLDPLPEIKRVAQPVSFHFDPEALCLRDDAAIADLARTAVRLDDGNSDEEQ